MPVTIKGTPEPLFSNVFPHPTAQPAIFMAVTLALVKELKEPNYQDYFENWARVWCQKAREQYQQLLLSVDVHSPTELRANMQPRNFPEWYATYKVTKKDQMYLAPSKRVTIW